MKKIIVLILMGVYLTTGCQPQKELENIELATKNVRVIQAETKKYLLTLEYVGIVDSKDLRTTAFKTGGKIEEIFVKTGQQVNKGDKLLRVNEEDLKTQVALAKSQYEMAKAQYNIAINGAVPEDINQVKMSMEIAEKNYINTKEIYEKNEKLLELEAIPQQQLQDIKLKLDIEEKQLNSAKEAYKKILNGVRNEEVEILRSQMDRALIAYQQNQDLLENSILKNEIEGIVQQILVKEGDYTTQGIPAIIIKGKESTVKVGVTSEDLSQMNLGMSVVIKHQNNEVKGMVETISSIPASQSTLYEVTIKLEPNEIPIGTLVDITFILGEKQGLFVPMNSLLNEGSDFIYIVKDEKALMKEVVLGEVFGNEIEVKQGIMPNDKVIIEGMRSLKNEDWINIKE